MADSKISTLTALVAADVAGADVLPIVDTSATTTKKVSTADLAEYVSTSSAISNLLSPKAPLASPALTGTPTAPTAAADTNTTQIATTAYVVGQGYAKLASPALTGTPTAPTAAADTNTTQVATTAYVVGQVGTATPLMNNTAAVGTSLKYSRQDHVHPSDTTRAPLASPTFTGTPAAPTAADGTNTTQIATTAFVQAQSQVDQFILASAIF